MTNGAVKTRQLAKLVILIRQMRGRKETRSFLDLQQAFDQVKLLEVFCKVEVLVPYSSIVELTEVW
jgi:hypothetical protein